MFSEFAKLKSRTINHLSQFEKYFEDQGRNKIADMIKDAKREITNLRYNIAVIGFMKRGKSTLINVLMGRKDDCISPIQCNVCTSAIVKYVDLKYSSFSEETAIVDFYHKEFIQIPFLKIKDYITEENNRDNIKQVKKVTVYGNFPLLNECVSLIDSPGKGSIHKYHDVLLEEYLPLADAIIFPIAADLPLEESEINFLKLLSEKERKSLFFVLTKRDTIKENEIDDVRTFIDSEISKTGISCNKLYETSAKIMFEFLIKDTNGEKCERLKEETGIKELEKDLESHILEKSNSNISLYNRIKWIFTEIERNLIFELNLTNNYLNNFSCDINTFNKKQKDFDEECRCVRSNRDRAIKNFESSWKKYVDSFSYKIKSKAFNITTRLRSELENLSLISSISKSLQIKRCVISQVRIETEPLILDLHGDLENCIKSLNEDLNIEIESLLSHSDFKDFTGTLLGYGGITVGGASAVAAGSCVLTNVASVISVWSNYVIAMSSATQASAETGLIPSIWYYFAGGGKATAAAATLAGQGPIVLSTTVAGIATTGFAFLAVWIGQLILKEGISAVLKGKLPSIIEKAVIEVESQMMDCLEKRKEILLIEYNDRIEEIILSIQKNFEELKNSFEKNDPAIELQYKTKSRNLLNLYDQHKNLQIEISEQTPITFSSVSEYI